MSWATQIDQENVTRGSLAFFVDSNLIDEALEFVPVEQCCENTDNFGVIVGGHYRNREAHSESLNQPIGGEIANDHVAVHERFLKPRLRGDIVADPLR